MKLEKIFALAIIVAALGSHSLNAEENAASTQNPKALLQEVAEVTGKAGAMKRDLMKEIPEAKKLQEEIKTLRQRARDLDQKLDTLLAEKSTEYQKALQLKDELIEKYRNAVRQKAQHVAPEN